MNEITTTWPPLSTLVAIGLLILIIVFLYFVLAKTLDKLYQVHKKHEKAHLELLHIFCWLRDPLNAPEPDMASHTETENLILINIHRLKTEPHYKVFEWQPISTAPKDGSVVWLALADDDVRSNAFEDTEGLVRTLGFNNFDQNGVDEWDMVGWNWCQDEFTKGTGTPLYWKKIDWFNLPPNPELRG